jgi:glutamate racemase
VLPPTIALVDSAESTASAVAVLCATRGEPERSRATLDRRSMVQFFATDSVEKFRRAGEKFLGRTIENVHHVDLE